MKTAKARRLKAWQRIALSLALRHGNFLFTPLVPASKTFKAARKTVNQRKRRLAARRGGVFSKCNQAGGGRVRLN